MVSQVVCVICSILPVQHTTEITFYKFPKNTERSVLYKAWKTALLDVLAKERPELSDDASLNDTYICSRHFTASDFSFDNGKLVLKNESVPSRIAKDLYEVATSEKVDSILPKEYEPSTRTNNFASTLMKDFVTTSHHNLRSDLISTETSRVLTPTVSEYITSLTKMDGKSFADATSDKFNEHKRRIDLEHKIETYGKIFKRLRSDNLLTESYVDELKEQMPEMEQLLNEALKTE
ncbi:uncharacterized protein LOC129580266 [Sitodiplosis mosellana]|uniref:uncharacterized protein LOC129580266 n=1 Tax=Sitodiplosis mosellana TaxID=263140 RepID=UPI0024445F8F|nr:uncharacterized protein LOC129580266 [Sitodiplosis mosellana]